MSNRFLKKKTSQLQIQQPEWFIIQITFINSLINSSSNPTLSILLAKNDHQICFRA